MWERHLRLVRLYKAIEQVMEPLIGGMPPQYRAELYAQAALQQLSGRRWTVSGAVEVAWDRRLHLEPRQRHLLAFLTGCALGLPSQEQEQLLGEALELCRLTWVPSTWAPWMGPAPSWARRHAVGLLLPDEPSPDPTGDPVSATLTQLEPLRRPSELLPMAAILEGLDLYQLICRERLGLEVGAWRLGTRAALQRLMEATDEGWTVKELREIRQVLQFLAG